MIGNYYMCKPPASEWNKRPKANTTVKLIARWNGQKAKRNVLVECCCCGHRWTRPFRGMRRLIEGRRG